MDIETIEKIVTDHNDLHSKVRDAGMARLKAEHGKDHFLNYLYLSSFYVDEGELYAEFAYFDDCPYEGNPSKEIKFTAEEVAVL